MPQTETKEYTKAYEDCEHENQFWLSGEVGVIISLNGDVYAECTDCGAQARISEQPEEYWN